MLVLKITKLFSGIAYGSNLVSPCLSLSESILALGFRRCPCFSGIFI
jgi:hypothetical protein